MKKLFLGTTIALLTLSSSAQEPPNFFKNTYPKHALEAILQAQGILEGEQAELDAKTRELVSLAVAAQIPCDYCIYAHTKGAQANGATTAEIREAIAAAATVRMWSTVLNGNAYDLETFKKEVDALGGPN